MASAEAASTAALIAELAIGILTTAFNATEQGMK
jgi:hypothetical protein